jgi:hypothetical protein
MTRPQDVVMWRERFEAVPLSDVTAPKTRSVRALIGARFMDPI